MEDYCVLISNLDKIIGMVGLILGVEVIAILIFLFLITNLRNPVIAGLAGNISSFCMVLGIIIIHIKQEIG